MAYRHSCSEGVNTSLDTNVTQPKSAQAAFYALNCVGKQTVGHM